MPKPRDRDTPAPPFFARQGAWYPPLCALPHFHHCHLTITLQYNSMAYDFKDFTEKQRKFCEEYVLCLNAKEAARRAGYTSQQQLLDLPHIKATSTTSSRSASSASTSNRTTC